MHFRKVANGLSNIYTAFMPYMNTLYNIFRVPDSHKFEQNKTRITDTDYEHINTKKWELI